MARTWTSVATVSPAGAGDGVNTNRAVVRSSEVFFGVRGHIYKWNGTTATALTTTSSFPDSPVGGPTAPIVYDICVFNNELFAGIGYLLGTDEDAIYRYTSGTTWVEDAILEDEDGGTFPYPHIGVPMPTNTEGLYFYMDCDATYMFISTRQATTTGQTVGRLISRNTSGLYETDQMPGGGYDSPQPQLVGFSKGSSLNQVIGVNRTGSNTYRAIQRGSPNFSNLSGSDIGDKRLLGYGDGKSFWSVLDGSNWELKYSTDWGVTLSAAGNIENSGTDERSGFVIKDCGIAALMMAVYEPGSPNNQIYTWDTATDTFVADGTITSGRGVHDFFVINGHIYLVADGSSANSVEIWDGGVVEEVPEGNPALYYGITTPTYRSEIPILVKPGSGALTITPAGAVVIGARDSGEIYYNETAPYDVDEDWIEMSSGYNSDDVNRIEVV